HIDARTRGEFVAGRGAPGFQPHYAVPRATAPIYAAGTRAASGLAGTIRTVSPGSPGLGGTAPSRDTRGPVGSRADVQGAAATFRNRGRATTSTGTGFPAPARTPRDSAVITTRGTASPGVTRERPADDSNAPAAVDRRAVPRGGDRADTSGG